MNRETLRLITGAAVLLVLSCQASRVAGQLLVAPGKAAPGASLFLHHPAGSFVDAALVVVLFDSTAARRVRIVNQTSIEVMVPRLNSGPSTVSLFYDGQPFGNSAINVVSPPLLKLLFRFDAGVIELMERYPAVGKLGKWETVGDRLSYDVLDANDNVTHTGVVNHPRQANFEVFGDPGAGGGIRSIPRGGAVEFLIRIPNPNGPVRIRFFDAPATLDLNTPQGRADRVRIADVDVP